MKRFLIGTSCLAMMTMSAPAGAQDKYIGEVFMVGFTFCPRFTASAEGQLLSIASNTALFSLLGTTYGGDGRTTFALPDLRGRSPIGQGTGPGLTTVVQGQASGTETVTLTINQMPSHNHDARVRASNQAPNTNNPAGNTFPTFASGTNQYTTGDDNVTMGDNEVQIRPNGGSQPFSIRDPYIGMRYCVVTQGIFPPRN